MPKTFAIGIDLGGTSIKAGVVDQKGRITDQLTVDSKANKGPSAVIQQIVFAIQDIFGRNKRSECMGIGIGAPGVVSLEDELVKYPPNFVDWGEVPLGKSIRKMFPVPVFVENDANDILD